VGVILSEVIDDTGRARVDQSPAQVLVGHYLSGRGPHERWSAQENGSLAPYDDRFVGHRGHVRAAGGARAQHGRNLGDAIELMRAWL